MLRSFLNNFFLSISFIFHFIFAEISLTACPVLAKTWLFHTLKSLRSFVVVYVKFYQNFSLKIFSRGKINWALAFAPEGRKANVNASSPTSLLEAMILAHDLIVLVSENTKNKNKSRDLEGARWPRSSITKFFEVG